uniref:Uncharacterized protein n=1 Tax=Candidatus Methanophagaceae archaeon ANME-1 ERB6 TaxID=2759912 RepID=A0A7G9YV97_9EURY|nr:hypothetical protein HCMLNGLJ_00001 [Methanosarcinales archaeon ANME-1 ERB6]QNO51931.1 hypothetical protein CGPAMFBJ_00002 [Methanosarcinales archaeon ANME-1 ERB6]
MEISSYCRLNRKFQSGIEIKMKITELQKEEGEIKGVLPYLLFLMVVFVPKRKPVLKEKKTCFFSQAFFLRKVVSQGFY